MPRRSHARGLQIDAMAARLIIRFLPAAAGLVLMLGASNGAVAKDPVSTFLDGLFAPKETIAPPDPAARVAPATTAARAGQSHPSRSAAAGAAHPLPPRRPAELAGSTVPPAGADAAVPTGATTPIAFVEPPRTQIAALPATPEAAVEELNGYFNGITTLVGDFIQFGGDGRRYEGTLYLQKPGRVRFEYKPPATLEVIADGQSVAVRDRRLATQDLYAIGQTPLKFLLKERVDLGRDMKVLNVVNKPDAIRVTVEDRATFGGTSRITLTYDPRENALKQWVVVDPQGFETTVALYNLNTRKRPDPKLFTINYERMLDTSR